MTQKNNVAGTALFQAAAHLLDLDVELAMAQALLEFSILMGRPDGQHPVFLESRAGGGYSTIVIELGVVRGGKCGRAVVHIEQHGVEPVRVRSERDRNVIHFDAHTRIL